MKIKLLSLVMCLGIVVPGALRAELLAYEGFNYTSGGNLAGLNGGTGWNGGWQNVNGGGSVQSGNLAAGGNAPSSYDARSLGNSAFVNTDNRSGRLLDCSPNGIFKSHGYIDSNGRIGADGKTLYISFLQQPSDVTKFYEFEFHRGNLGDPGRIAGVGNDYNSTTVNLRAPSSTHTPIGPGNTNVNFYVVRIDFKPGNDDVYIYRNPTKNLESANEPVLTMLSVADMSFDGLSMAAFLNGMNVKHDEIRLGETWNDVLGGPPTFVIQPANQNGYVGQTAMFTSLAQSKQSLTYQWCHNNNAILTQTNANLTLLNLQPADAGDYWNVASNSLGMVTSRVANLNIQAIAVSIPSQTLTLGHGTNLLIAATVGGVQPVTLQWFKDGIALQSETNSTFARANADVFDAGQYVLVASNAYGMVTSSVLTVYTDLGAILAYEGFDYPQGTGNLAAQNGGRGWNGVWANVGGSPASVISGNLPAGTNATANFDSHSAGNSVFQPNNSRSGRFLDCSDDGSFAARGLIDSNGNIGADGKTIYLSFLQQPDGTDKFYEFEFHRGDLGDSGRIGGIGNDTGDTGVHFRVQTPAGGASRFWDLGPGNTNVNFYVMRIDFKPGNDDVCIYRNPSGTNEGSNAPILTLPGAGDLSFNGISLACYVNNRTVNHDEIRLGLTWADVVGNSVSLLKLAERSNRTSRIRLAGSPNSAYQLQGASAVTGPWTNVTRMITPASGMGEFLETNALAQRYYRTIAEPSLPVITAPTDEVIADFEGSTYGDWITTGTAFGPGPAHSALPNQMTIQGYTGTGLVNSFYGGDDSTGTLTSPVFKIDHKFLQFHIGGGGWPGKTCMNLLVDGQVVRTATGPNTQQGGSELLQPQQWDVSDYLNQNAIIQIVDTATGSWGHINVDQIVLTDIPFPALSRQFTITNNLLNLPVKNGAAMRRVSIAVDGAVVRDFDIELADATPDWWAITDLSPYLGKTATLTVNSLSAGSTALSSIIQSNGIVGATNLYSETLRPQIHFSARRGWLNDANAMVYYQGEYHLYFQHNPYGWNWGNMHWGHAVSPDMIHWQELPEGIYPHAYQDDVFSGSGIIDWANTGGFKTGTNDVIVAAYTSTGRGECIAFSNDRGRTFTDYANDPVVVHNGRDPRLLWYAPSNYWVMALYDESGGGGISFYSSPNLRQWTYRSKIMGFYECPDLFQMPVDGNTNNMQWLVCDASSGYMLGQFDGAVFTPNTGKLPGNSGSAFYASQTYSTMPSGDSRRVRIGWAQISIPGMPFNQMMYFPTELTLRTLSDGVRLCSQPIKEIANLHGNEYSWTNFNVAAGSNPLSGIRGTLFDLQAEFVPGAATQATFNFCGVSVVYNGATQQISCNGISNPLPPVNGVVRLQVLVDRTSIEIFGNNGQIYMPMPANYSNNTVSLTSQGGTTTFNSLKIYKLNSSWPQP